MRDIPVTIVDVFDEYALSSPVREELYKCYPGARLAHLKSGGNFPYLSRGDQVNVYLQVHSLFLSYVFKGSFCSLSVDSILTQACKLPPFQIHLRGFQGTPDSPWEASAEDPYWKEIHSNDSDLAGGVEDGSQNVLSETHSESQEGIPKSIIRGKSNSATLL